MTKINLISEPPANACYDRAQYIKVARVQPGILNNNTCFYRLLGERSIANHQAFPLPKGHGSERGLTDEISDKVFS